MRSLLLILTFLIAGQVHAAGKTFECILRNTSHVVAEGVVVRDMPDQAGLPLSVTIEGQAFQFGINYKSELVTKDATGLSKIWYPNRINDQMVFFPRVMGDYSFLCQVPELKL